MLTKHVKARRKDLVCDICGKLLHVGDAIISVKSGRASVNCTIGREIPAVIDGSIRSTGNS